jgi:TetR/AcrR family tetracycline transcriptional repressor
MPLRRAEVIAAALVLLDDVGLDGLTTRRLAAKLGVQVGALYWHVPSKQALLEAMADRLMDGVADQPLPQGSWEEQVAAATHQLRRALLAHRDGARLLVGAIGLGPHILATAERFFRLFRAAGFSLSAAARGWDMIASFVTGFVLQEQAVPLDPRGTPSDPARWAAMIDPDRFPNLAAWLPQRPADREDLFATELRVILCGLRSELS